MDIRIAFRHMEHSAAVENHARKELEKVTKLLQKEDDLIHLDFVLDAAVVHAHHKVELRLNSKHYHLIASEEGADLYLLIDHVVKTMAHEVKKHKEKRLDKRNHPESLKEGYMESVEEAGEGDDYSE